MEPRPSSPEIHLPRLQQQLDPDFAPLFSQGTEIDPALLRSFMAKPEAALLPALYSLLDFGVQHFEAYRVVDAQTQLARSEVGFVLHATLMLTERGGAQLSDQLLPRLCAYSQPQIDFWFEDRAEHVLWQPFFKALSSSDGFSRVQTVVAQPVHARSLRAAAITALAQYGHQYRHALDAVSKAIQQLLRQLSQAPDDADAPLLLGMLIAEASSLRLASILPLIRDTFASGRVDSQQCGSLQDIETAITGLVNNWAAMEWMDLYALYAFFNKTERVEFTETPPKNTTLDFSKPKVAQGKNAQGRGFMPPKPQTLRPTHKAGRNDLCPCGSGLKFKKCHGR